MPPKRGIANLTSNILEATQEPVRQIKTQAVKGLSRDLAQMLYGGPGVAKTEEEIKHIEKQDRMMKNEIYGQRLRELGLMQGKNIEEITIAPEQREEIEKLYKSYSEFEQGQREEAKNLGVATQNTQEDEYQKRKLEEEENAREEAQEQMRLNTIVETPLGKETGPTFGVKGFKRRPNPMRGMPRATAMLRRSGETRVGRGIGG